ncbi:bacteriochlorophyll 4-vinyl reductase [Oscillochloris trichoides DG-6]|uniref:Bacteriochlorophyll 4-vinyl reductase n=1 Tax=Oscillochloris trichoides DG-6 TaxID=765420 RepID=E1I9V5_9CHLR|nr:bacteriochlorophyll 4-vinyl reductase [Oscillochloris trichoides DG-6]
MEDAVVAATMHAAKIGPNSIIQTIAALREVYPAEELPTLLAGGAEIYLSELPHEMIPEEQFHALVALLTPRLGVERAGDILFRSGERTADYVRANRIPGPFQALVGILPAPLGLRLLLLAISKHAWTFAGSGKFSFHLGRGPWLSIGKPVDRDTSAIAAVLCRYYCGAFTQLLRRVVNSRITLRETTCQARGGAACVYQIVL